MSDVAGRVAKLSPEKLELLMRRLNQKREDVSSTKITPQNRESNSFPLSFAQQRLWFLNQLEPSSLTYNLPTAISLTGPLIVAALENSINEIQRRHEALRTTFAVVDGQPIQVLTPPVPWSLPVMDLTELTETEQEAEVQRLVQQPFDLSCGPLWQTHLLRLGSESHVLLLNVHHIVFDDWSFAVFLQELTALYEAFCAGRQSPLPQLPLQYADFALWQRQWLQGGALEKQLSYWKQQLDGALTVVELPTDRPRPALQTYRGARQSIILSQQVSQALKLLSQREEVTLFMVLLAAFATLLYRYTGQSDILVGSPIAGRNQVETEGLIGFFVNTLVMRTQLGGNPTFRQLLARVRQVALGAYSHQDLPFEKLVEELQPQRDPSRSPLLQVLFVLQNAPKSANGLSGLTLNFQDIDIGTAKFDLTLELQETSEGLRGWFEYNTDLFDAGTIARMAGHFQTLLEGILRDPEQKLSQLPLLTPAERQLLLEWNDTKTDYPKNTCIHQLFEAQVARSPDAVAVVFEQQQLTYRELNQRANQLAHYLQTCGVGPEVLVGICVERSLEMVVGVLGILKAGGAYVPLDPAYPQERLAFMLQDSQVPVLLTQQRLQAGLPKHSAHVVCMDSDWETISSSGMAWPTAPEVSHNPTSGVTSNNLAYVIYTSGSTGKPKGVQIQHRSAVNLLNSVRQQPGLTQQDTLLSVTSLSFDIAVSEIFLPLAVGARLILVSREVASDGIELLKALTTSGATFMQPTPITWRLLLAAGWQGSPDLTMICTGEALPRDLANQLLPKGAALWNLYGPTETTIWSTACKVELSADPVCIGRPLANTQVYILDENLQPVPIGVPGELHIGGEGLARGYLNRTDLTINRFISNPFSEEPEARLYKTGDLARYLPDGQIECLGRIDEQVKVRGFRIELGEIETTMAQHPAVEEAVVVVREDTPGEKTLVGYLVPGTLSKADLKAASATNQLIPQLRQFLKQRLPDYMVPVTFVSLDAMPLTANGKVDRKALPIPDSTRPEPEESYVPPRTATEQQIADIWAQVLHVERVGIHDNFFELGGHSLLAIHLFAQIEKIFGKNLPLATLFQAPTVEQLSSILCQKEWSAPWSSLVAIQPNGSKPPFFCIYETDGNNLSYRNIAHYLDPEQPVYGLQPHFLDEKQALNIRVEDMAAHYIKEIRTLQPEGPYFLGGLCLGGLVAFEMAQQLYAQGQKVALLALFDAAAGVSSAPISHKVYRHLSYLSQLRPQEQLTYILHKAKGKILRPIKRMVKLITYKFYLNYELPLPQVPRIPVREVLFLAFIKYVPQVYPGRVTLFRAENGVVKLQPDPNLGWSELAAGGLEIHDIPGTHDEFTDILTEPHVQVLAEKLRACLDESRRRYE